MVMETNRYAPPKAVVADRVEPLLKQRRIVTMLVFSIVTLGFYYPLWFLRRRAALNQLDSSRKLQLWPFVMFFAYFAIQFVIGFVSELSPGTFAGSTIATIRQGTWLLVGIIMLMQCFIVKEMLEDHLTVQDDDGLPAVFVEQVRLSGLMTFFFGILYLQWAINRYHDRLTQSEYEPEAAGA